MKEFRGKERISINEDFLSCGNFLIVDARKVAKNRGGTEGYWGGLKELSHGALISKRWLGE